MHLQSPYPDPPTLPELNSHHIILKRPDQAEWPDYTLHIDAITGERRKYKEFVKRVDDLATALGAPLSQGGLGLKAEDGEIIGIVSENCMDYVTLVHSCLMIATPFALISSYSTPFELKHALTLSKATRLFVDANLLTTLLPVAKEAGIPSDKIYLLRGEASGFKSVQDFVNDTNKKNIPFVGIRPVKNDTLAYLVFSSGTSGLPKAVMISHGNINFSIAQSMVMAQATLEVYTPPPPPTPEGIPCTLAFLPLHHTYGLHTYTFRAFLAPSTFVILGKWDIKTTLAVIPKYKITAIALIPSAIHQLVNYPDIHEANLSTIQTLGSGAAYLPPELATKLSALVPKQSTLTEGYGMSEATIAAITQPFPGSLGGKMKRINGSTGVLLPGMEARLLRDDGSAAGVNEPAELWLKSPNVALGYWNNEKADRETFVNGWLRTGDKFRVDEEGYFFFADRAKDTLKVSGIQVSPVEIEDVLLANPRKLITDATVAGVSGHGRTSDEKVPHAWVVLSQRGKKLGAQAVIKELENWHKKNLSKYKWLRGGIEIIDEIPKSPTGKTLRRVLQDQYESRLRTKSKL
ncbi:acetyl-CoA synthetase-like protein [Macrolepiota fuliginosa MF-IS2]|uniref:Acetyl-CoA synthetase-like protein n=1 Tax=Macrolepiota fuliginosa MF-IS2 TaxID=1400762 RepID=A0A9P5XMG2_9AGAR|nr:acetyl-CoA synthetase-like protein [Macrolepiota fuliginosa MF-IS2]